MICGPSGGCISWSRCLVGVNLLVVVIVSERESLLSRARLILSTCPSCPPLTRRIIPDIFLIDIVAVMACPPIPLEILEPISSPRMEIVAGRDRLVKSRDLEPFPGASFELVRKVEES
jgi:hypothetical protein